MTDPQTALARMVDENAIRNAPARCADAVMRGDYDGLRQVWTSDARWAIGQPPQVDVWGVDDIVATLRRLRGGKDFFVQFAAEGRGRRGRPGG